MKTLLIQVGKTVNKHFIAGINDYVERIGHYMPFEVVTIPELKNTKNLTEEQQKQAEGELILKQLQPTDTVVLLDEHGKEYRSIEFARWLEQKQQTGWNRNSRPPAALSSSSEVPMVSHLSSTNAPTNNSAYRR